MAVTRTPTPAAVQYPLLFSARDVVFGNGFVADVVVERGRVLGEEEAEGWWVHGINPGALAGSGKTVLEAFNDFRTSLTSTLFDLANEADSFEEFKSAVISFFNETNRVLEKDWLQRNEMTKSGELPALKGIPVIHCPAPMSVDVELREPAFTVAYNVVLTPTLAFPVARAA